MQHSEQKLRLDRWLWAARFYKTRALANNAIKSGHITVNQLRAKPAKLITIGDQLRIRKAQLVFNVRVEALSEKRLGAKLAQALYSESEHSIDTREQRKLEIKSIRQTLINGRPSKKDRRLQAAIKRQYP